eukprot:5738-Heterococcus_DN1.PRE.1
MYSATACSSGISATSAHTYESTLKMSAHILAQQQWHSHKNESVSNHLLATSSSSDAMNTESHTNKSMNYNAIVNARAMHGNAMSAMGERDNRMHSAAVKSERCECDKRTHE